MSTLSLAIIFGLLILSSSGFFLRYVLKSRNSTNNSWIPLACTLSIIVISTQLRDFSEALTFFAAALAQFTAYVFVSRLRQRGSFFWHVIAALASNSAWYATMHFLKAGEAYWLLLLPYIFGLVAGRISGVMWSQYVEEKFNLKGDATRDDRLVPGKRLGFMAKEWTFWVLVIVLAFYTLYGYANFESKTFNFLLLVIGLGIVQNFFYALGTRAAARGNSWFIATTGILQGIFFYISAAVLFSQNMPAELIIPYVLSTTLGSATGAVCSMILEYIYKLKPDAHLSATIKQKNTKIPYVFITVLAVIWVLFQESILNFFGYSVSVLILPLPFVSNILHNVLSTLSELISIDLVYFYRPLIVLIIAFISLFDSAFHTLTSRAGNRNHTGYHITTLIPKGLVDFFRMGSIALNSKAPDLIPIAVLGGALGSLFGKDLSEKVERWLQARMDVEPEPVKKPAAVSS